MKLLLKIICLLSPFLVFSCLEDPDCVTTTANRINASFYKERTGERDTIVVNSIRAIGSDSIFVANDTITTVQLPLDPTRDRITYIFDSNLGIDSLFLSYKLGTRLISEDCGIEFIYTGLGYVKSGFDSVSIVNEVPLEEINEDLQIYN